MDTERVFAELARKSDEIIGRMQDWRTAHPHATFAELERAVDDRLDGPRARMLRGLALASTSANGADLPEAGRAVCADYGTPCGHPLPQPHGRCAR
jgi:hypothetical protein